MKKVKVLIIALVAVMAMGIFVGCDGLSEAEKDRQKILGTGNEFVTNQPTPTDIGYSLERYNLIRRAYWINGQREKAINLPCEIVKPLGYVILFTASGSVVGRFIVDGKVTCLNTYLTPLSEYYEKNGSSSSGTYRNEWMPDVDGCFGENIDGIFFFTTDGRYVEWTGDYIYSDIPFLIDDPILHIGE